MAFESFDKLAREGLKRSQMGPSRVLVRTEFKPDARAQTTFRFSDDIVAKAGWTPGKDRICLAIDRDDLAIRATRVQSGGYKLISNGTGRPYVKFTAARGMPVADTPAEAADVVVVGGEIMFVLPEGTRITPG